MTILMLLQGGGENGTFQLSLWREKMDRDELDRLLKESVEQVKNMTPEERAAMLRRQAEGVARAEASWPKPKYRWESGVKVYESYEDYCND
jgi:hypothetical protein